MDHLSQGFFPFFKGRVALYAILKAIGIKKGAEIILPGFTCVVVSNAIIYLGAKPVYVDIDPGTFNIDVTKIEKEVTEKTAAIIAQNTFGLSSDLDPILEIANKYKIKVIEDCAHGFGGTYKGQQNGTVADAAFFSTQWSKPFSTGLGGFAVSSNSQIKAKIENECKSYSLPNITESIMLWGLLRSYDLLMRPAIYWPAIKAYRALSRLGIVTGSSSDDELLSPQKPAGFEKRMPLFLQKRVRKEIERFSDNLKHRLWVVARYDEIFDNMGLGKPYKPDYALHTFLRYSFLVKDKKTFLRRAEESRIEAGDWFVSPLHPIEGDLSSWSYVKGSCPVAENVCGRIVNLPTHKRINAEQIHKVEKVLIKMKAQGVL